MSTSAPTHARVLAAEAIGTAALLAIVVGSGIMGDSLSGGNVAVALLANALATGAGLVVLVMGLGPISGAHFNPVVTALAVRRGALPASHGAQVMLAQLAGGAAGVVLAHAMFDHALVAISAHARSGVGQAIGEATATFGLVGVVTVLPRVRPEATAWAVGLYITSAYWFTSSTSFANPAVTLARTLTDTFAGIAPADAPTFVGAQIAGAALGALVFDWLAAPPATAASEKTS
jgi:glycerol uptake facilitator-like aquaporin